MIFCPECGTVNPDNAKFCKSCGKNFANLFEDQKKQQKAAFPDYVPPEPTYSTYESSPEPAYSTYESSPEPAYSTDDFSTEPSYDPDYTRPDPTYSTDYAQSEPSYSMSEEEAVKEQKTPPKNFRLLAIIEGVALLLVVGVVFAIGINKKKTEKPDNTYFETLPKKNAGDDTTDTTDITDDESSCTDEETHGEKASTGTQAVGVQTESSEEYVIAASNQRLLTNSDIYGLSVRELNYAKNEIYARHGRKFLSGELRDYFNSKSWYQGIYEPNEFDEKYAGVVISDLEKKNIDFLREAEYNAQSGGYKLNY